MHGTHQKYHMQAINALLRMLPMAAKLLLALYMGKFFQLEDIGAYGLALGTVSVLGVILGQDLIYVVSRDIVGADPATALYKMRDQALHYGINYLFLTAIVFFMISTHAVAIAPKVLIYTLILTILESFGTVTYYNMNSLNQQILANAMFCIRGGLWVLPVLALCVLDPKYRTADTVLIGWIIGAAASLVATFWCWRHYPWREVMPRPVNWAWIKKGIRKGVPVWLGMMGLTGGTFVDRFVVEHYLTMNDVGVLTFYFSFTNAMLTLMQSGVMAFSTPRMIKHHRDGNIDDFHHEARTTTRQIALGAGLVALALGIGVPAIAWFFNRPALIAEVGTFWLMLLSTWRRANAETFSNILFARHQDKAVWLGNMLFLIPALGCNLLFVPIFGFKGIGFGAVLAAMFLLGWRWWHVRAHRYEPEIAG